MSSVDPSQIPGLVTDAGYPVMLEAYSQEPAMRQMIFEMEACDGTEYGVTERVIVGADEPAEIPYGGSSHSRTVDEGYQWWLKQRKLAEDIVIREEEYRNPNANALLASRVASAAGRFGQGFQRKKEQIAADLFIYGAYTAGRIAVFDGSFPGHPDSYPAYIYDGKPWLAASGNGHPLFLDSSVTKYNKTANSLTSTNLETARILMSRTNAVDEANQVIRIDPDVLVVPPELTQTAEIILNSLQAPGSANNDVNTMRGRFGLLQWRYLTDTDGWFLGTARRGLKFRDSGDPMITVSEPDRKTGDVTIRFVSYAGAAVTDWRYWSGHNISAS